MKKEDIEFLNELKNEMLSQDKNNVVKHLLMGCYARSKRL